MVRARPDQHRMNMTHGNRSRYLYTYLSYNYYIQATRVRSNTLYYLSADASFRDYKRDGEENKKDGEVEGRGV